MASINILVKKCFPLLGFAGCFLDPSLIMSILANAHRGQSKVTDSEAGLKRYLVLKILGAPVKIRIKSAKVHCFVPVWPSFTFESRFKLSPIFWNKLTAVQIFTLPCIFIERGCTSITILFWRTYITMSRTCRAYMTSLIEDQRLKNFWRNFPPREAICHH